MNGTLLSQAIEVDSLVDLAHMVAGTRHADGRLILREDIGHGIVREVDLFGNVLVHWPTSKCETWVVPDDLEPLDPRARLVNIYRKHFLGSLRLAKCKIISNAGLKSNWTVEFMPSNVIRTRRFDGAVWTFDWNRIMGYVEPHGVVLEYALARDDHAEALTVAELALH